MFRSRPFDPSFAAVALLVASAFCVAAQDGGDIRARLPAPRDVSRSASPGAASSAPSSALDVPDSDAETISFSFEKIDIRVFTQIVGAFTGKTLVVEDGAEGFVSVVSQPVTREQAYSLFAAVLESSGFTLQQDGAVERVVALPERDSRMGAIIADGGELPAHGLVTLLIQLKHISAGEIRKTLESQLGEKDGVSVLEETNHLVITDTAERLRRVRELVDLLDKPGMAGVTEVIALQHADAFRLAAELNVVFSESLSAGQQLKSRLPPAPSGNASGPTVRAPSIVASEHSNKLIVSGSQRQVQAVKDLVAEMDVPAPSGRSSINYIPLSFLRAEDVSKNITTLLEKFAAGNTDPALARRVAVEAMPGENVLLVISSPEDFREVSALVSSLDVRPLQVHISVVIAEISESDSDKLGLQISGGKSPDSVGGNGWGMASRFEDETNTGSGMLGSIAAGLFGDGLTLGIARGSYTDANGRLVSDYPALFQLDAQRANAEVKIVANPTLTAKNHEKSSVTIVDNIPMTEATITGTGDDRDIIQNITRTDVGVKLMLTPHIVPGGQVQIDLEPTIEAITDTGNGSDYAPTISKRSVKTTSIVDDGETIVIAGLSRTDTTEIEKRIPLLGDIPLLGWFFRWSSDVEQRTNILVFVTPHVISNQGDADRVRADLEDVAGFSAESLKRDLSASGDDAESED